MRIQHNLLRMRDAPKGLEKKQINNLTKTKVGGYQTQTKHGEYLRAKKKEEILKDGSIVCLKRRC